jgi:hypothetical protein
MHKAVWYKVHLPGGRLIACEWSFSKDGIQIAQPFWIAL